MEFYVLVLFFGVGFCKSIHQTSSRREFVIGKDYGPQLVQRPYYYWCPYNWEIAPCSCGGDIAFPLLTCERINDFYTFTKWRNNFPRARFPRRDFGKFTLTNSLMVTNLPRDIFGIVTFEYIFIKKNPLKTIAKGAFDGQSNSLKRLEIVHCDVTIFPFEDMRKLLKLEVLSLTYNNISNIPDSAFGTVRNLKKVKLDFNKINYIGANAFKDLAKLQELDLQFNKLVVLNNKAFASKTNNNNLMINLAHNKLSFLSNDAFLHQSPNSLNISHNQLASFNEGVFKPVLDDMVKHNGGYIYTENNRFECICEKVKWLIMLSNVYKRHVVGFRCNNIRKGLEDLTLGDMGCPQE